MPVLDRDQAETGSARKPRPPARKPAAKAPAPRPRPRARKPAAAPVPRTANAVSRLRTSLNLNQPDFSRLFPLSVRTLASLEGGTTPSETVQRRLVELERLTRALAEVLRKEALGDWLKTPNPAFEGLKPLEVIERGESDRLWSMIYFLRSGVPS